MPKTPAQKKAELGIVVAPKYKALPVPGKDFAVSQGRKLTKEEGTLAGPPAGVTPWYVQKQLDQGNVKKAADLVRTYVEPQERAAATAENRSPIFSKSVFPLTEGPPTTRASPTAVDIRPVTPSSIAAPKIAVSPVSTIMTPAFASPWLGTSTPATPQAPPLSVAPNIAAQTAPGGGGLVSSLVNLVDRLTSWRLNRREK